MCWHADRHVLNFLRPRPKEQTLEPPEQGGRVAHLLAHFSHCPGCLCGSAFFFKICIWYFSACKRVATRPGHLPHSVTAGRGAWRKIQTWTSNYDIMEVSSPHFDGGATSQFKSIGKKTHFLQSINHYRYLDVSTKQPTNDPVFRVCKSYLRASRITFAFSEQTSLDIQSVLESVA